VTHDKSLTAYQSNLGTHLIEPSSGEIRTSMAVAPLSGNPSQLGGMLFSTGEDGVIEVEDGVVVVAVVGASNSGDNSNAVGKFWSIG